MERRGRRKGEGKVDLASEAPAGTQVLERPHRPLPAMPS